MNSNTGKTISEKDYMELLEKEKKQYIPLNGFTKEHIIALEKAPNRHMRRLLAAKLRRANKKVAKVAAL